LETLKEHDKLFQHKKCEKVSSEPLTSESYLFYHMYKKDLQKHFYCGLRGVSQK